MNIKKDIYKGKNKLLLLKNANIIDLYTGDVDYNKDVFIIGDRIAEVLDSRYENNISESENPDIRELVCKVMEMCYTIYNSI